MRGSVACCRTWKGENRMKRIERYGLPWLTEYGWEVIGRVLVGIGLVGLAVMQMGAMTP